MAKPRVKLLDTGAKSLGELAPRITRAAYETHGFPVAALINDWPAIAGAELAPFTRPERLVWLPKRAQSLTEEAGRSDRDRGATLYLRAEGPRAIEVQHAAPQLLDRLNTHFGYRAVTRIRIVQAPLGQDRVSPSAPSPQPGQAALTTELDQIDDEGLRDALTRLGQWVR